MNCERCKKGFPAGEDKRVPKWIVILGAISLAFAHGGLWAYEELSKAYCARCRRVVISEVLVFVALALSVVGIAAALWLRGPGAFGQ